MRGREGGGGCGGSGFCVRAQRKRSPLVSQLRNAVGGRRGERTARGTGRRARGWGAVMPGGQQGAVWDMGLGVWVASCPCQRLPVSALRGWVGWVQPRGYLRPLRLLPPHFQPHPPNPTHDPQSQPLLPSPCSPPTTPGLKLTTTPVHPVPLFQPFLQSPSNPHPTTTATPHPPCRRSGSRGTTRARMWRRGCGA